MFCYQCEQTARGTGCDRVGVCTKDHPTANLQDMLVALAKGIGFCAFALKHKGERDVEADRFVVQALFVTVTNVDFDPASIDRWVQRGVAIRDRLRERIHAAGTLPEAVTFAPAADRDGRVAQADGLGILARHKKLGDDRAGLSDLILFGLKGAAAYADHARVLGRESDELYDLFHEELAFLAEEAGAVDDFLAHALATGALNLKAMELLDAANTGVYGDPEPTRVRVTPVKGKAIVISGHDLKDLHDLLEQTEGKGVNVYTHGEMLPCHGYPGLKKYKHFVGHYGTAWQNQQKEFAAFPGAILLTTNCLMKPHPEYKDRLFTTGLVKHPDATHVANGHFAPVIEAALAAPGFAEDGPEQFITVGFGRHAVLSNAGAVVDAVKAGKIKHFFLVGGCDGAKPGRNYYTEFVEKTPKDTAILTCACGKYRFNYLDLGENAGLPRLLDMGQCNDSYGAIRVAQALAEAFGCGVNELPLSLVLSWYEQKAVAVLLALLHLGVKNIRLGPTLPAFVTPAVLKVLVDTFALTPIGTAEDDLKACLSHG